MKNLTLFLALTMVVGACGDKKFTTDGYVCNCSQKDSVKKFVIRLTADANNKSDEEMEDVIKEIYKTGVELNCDRRRLTYSSNDNLLITKLDSTKCESVLN